MRSTSLPLASARGWIAAAVIALASLSLTQAYGAAAPPTDREIDALIEQRLLSDPALPGNALDAEVKDAVVTLTGSVSNLLAKDRAASIAGAVRGVYSVTNNISVNVPERSDEAIRKDIRDAFLTSPAVESFEVLAEVTRGAVVLKGRVQSQRERLLALRLAQGVKGVRSVADEMQVEYQRTRPDSEIAADIRGALGTDFLLSRSLIDVAVENGKVALIGNVRSVMQKDRARDLSWVMGVRAVGDEKLRVQGWMAEKEKAAGPGGSDAAIKDSVERAVVRDPFVSLNAVLIDVSNGTVTLSGNVDNLQAKLSAEEAASSQAGVRRIKSLIKVRPNNPPTDEELKRSILAAFTRDPYLEELGMQVRANRGNVVLEGLAYSPFARTHAEELAQRQKGVVAVQNNLTVLPSPWDQYSTYSTLGSATIPAKSDKDLIEDIRSQLFWSPLVDAPQVAVTAADGVVTLTGSVDNRSESLAAERCAREAGAIRVKNLLKVSSH